MPLSDTLNHFMPPLWEIVPLVKKKMGDELVAISELGAMAEG
jgi:hypothetical protein